MALTANPACSKSAMRRSSSRPPREHVCNYNNARIRRLGAQPHAHDSTSCGQFYWDGISNAADRRAVRFFERPHDVGSLAVGHLKPGAQSLGCYQPRRYGQLKSCEHRPRRSVFDRNNELPICQRYCLMQEASLSIDELV
jgi:hypothetical protein